MDIHHYRSQLKLTFKNRHRLFWLASGSILLNGLFLILLLTHLNSERTIIVPAGFQQSFWVDKNGVSASYLSEMTRYFATLSLDMSPATSDYQMTQILNYTDPYTYGVMKDQLLSQADSLKDEQLSTIFFPVNITVDVSHLTATIVGDLTYLVGKDVTNTVRTSYTATYSYNDGRLYLMSFTEDKPHELPPLH